MERFDYTILLEQLEKKLYHKDIHQATIDIVEECQMSIDNPEDDNGLSFDTILGSLCYKVDNLLEICDHNLYDYGILKELMNILESK